MNRGKSRWTVCGFNYGIRIPDDRDIMDFLVVYCRDFPYDFALVEKEKVVNISDLRKYLLEFNQEYISTYVGNDFVFLDKSRKIVKDEGKKTEEITSRANYPYIKKGEEKREPENIGTVMIRTKEKLKIQNHEVCLKFMEALEEIKNGSSRIGINDRRILFFCDLLGGRTLVHYCCIHRNFEVLKEIVEFVEGQEPEGSLRLVLNRQEQTQGRTCLHELANRKTKEEDVERVSEMMDYLISKGGDLKISDIQGRSAYFLSFLCKNFFLKGTFIKHNPNFFTEEAADEGSFSLRTLFLRSLQLNTIETPFHKHAFNAGEKAKRRFSEKRRWFDTFYQSEVVEKIVKEDDVEGLKLLVLEQVILPEFYFMRSYFSGRTFLHDVVQKSKPKILNYLLFEVDGVPKKKKLVKDNWKKNAFHIAVADGSMEMVEMLLKFDESLVNALSGLRRRDVLLISSKNKKKEMFEHLYRLKRDRVVRLDSDGNHFLAALVSNKWNDLLRSCLSEADFGEHKKKIFDDLFRVSTITSNVEAFQYVESSCDDVPVKNLFQICLNSLNSENTQILDHLFDKYNPCKTDMEDDMIEMFVKLYSEKAMLMMLENDVKVDRLFYHIMHYFGPKLKEFVKKHAKEFTTTKSSEPRMDIFKMSYFADYKLEKRGWRGFSPDGWVVSSASLFPILLPHFSEFSLGGLNPNEILLKFLRALKESKNIPSLIKPSENMYGQELPRAVVEVQECLKKMYTSVGQKVEVRVFRYLFNTKCFDLLNFFGEDLLPEEIEPYKKEEKKYDEEEYGEGEEEGESDKEKPVTDDEVDEGVFSITPDLTSLDPRKYEKLSILIAKIMPEVYLDYLVLKKACARRRHVLAGYILLNMDNDYYTRSFYSELVNRSLSKSIHRVMTVYMEKEVLSQLDLPHMINLSFRFRSPETAVYILKFMKEEGMAVDVKVANMFVKHDFKEGVKYMIDEKYGLKPLLRYASMTVKPRHVLKMICEDISVFVDSVGGVEVLEYTSYRHDLMLECLKCLHSRGFEISSDTFNIAIGVFFKRKYSSIVKGECHIKEFADQVKKYIKVIKDVMENGNMVLDQEAFFAILEREEANFLLTELGPDRFPASISESFDLCRIGDEKLSVEIVKKYKELYCNGKFLGRVLLRNRFVLGTAVFLELGREMSTQRLKNFMQYTRRSKLFEFAVLDYMQKKGNLRDLDFYETNVGHSLDWINLSTIMGGEAEMGRLVLRHGSSLLLRCDEFADEVANSTEDLLACIDQKQEVIVHLLSKGLINEMNLVQIFHHSCRLGCAKIAEWYCKNMKDKLGEYLRSLQHGSTAYDNAIAFGNVELSLMLTDYLSDSSEIETLKSPPKETVPPTPDVEDYSDEEDTFEDHKKKGTPDQDFPIFSYLMKFNTQLASKEKKRREESEGEEEGEEEDEDAKRRRKRKDEVGNPKVYSFKPDSVEGYEIVKLLAKYQNSQFVSHILKKHKNRCGRREKGVIFVHACMYGHFEFFKFMTKVDIGHYKLVGLEHLIWRGREEEIMSLLKWDNTVDDLQNVPRVFGVNPGKETSFMERDLDVDNFLSLRGDGRSTILHLVCQKFLKGPILHILDHAKQGSGYLDMKNPDGYNALDVFLMFNMNMISSAMYFRDLVAKREEMKAEKLKEGEKTSEELEKEYPSLKEEDIIFYKKEKEFLEVLERFKEKGMQMTELGRGLLTSLGQGEILKAVGFEEFEDKLEMEGEGEDDDMEEDY